MVPANWGGNQKTTLLKFACLLSALLQTLKSSNHATAWALIGSQVVHLLQYLMSHLTNASGRFRYSRVFYNLVREEQSLYLGSIKGPSPRSLEYKIPEDIFLTEEYLASLLALNSLDKYIPHRASELSKT